MPSITELERYHARHKTQYSRYKKWNIRRHLIASRTWLLSYLKETYSCQLCNNTTTRTKLETPYLHKGNNMPQDVIICYKCIAKLLLRRDQEQPEMEKRLYG